jgi:hypothetical protein
MRRVTVDSQRVDPTDRGTNAFVFGKRVAVKPPAAETVANLAGWDVHVDLCVLARFAVAQQQSRSVRRAA